MALYDCDCLCSPHNDRSCDIADDTQLNSVEAKGLSCEQYPLVNLVPDHGMSWGNEFVFVDDDHNEYGSAQALRSITSPNSSCDFEFGTATCFNGEVPHDYESVASFFAMQSYSSISMFSCAFADELFSNGHLLPLHQVLRQSEAATPQQKAGQGVSAENEGGGGGGGDKGHHPQVSFQVISAPNYDQLRSKRYNQRNISGEYVYTSRQQKYLAEKISAADDAFETNTALIKKKKPNSEKLSPKSVTSISKSHALYHKPASLSRNLYVERNDLKPREDLRITAAAAKSMMPELVEVDALQYKTEISPGKIRTTSSISSSIGGQEIFTQHSPAYRGSVKYRCKSRKGDSAQKMDLDRGRFVRAYDSMRLSAAVDRNRRARAGVYSERTRLLSESNSSRIHDHHRLYERWNSSGKRSDGSRRYHFSNNNDRKIEVAPVIHLEMCVGHPLNLFSFMKKHKLPNTHSIYEH